jgi:hypothetical protein
VNPIFAAALELQAFCEEKDWLFCIIGALAVQRWGEPRLTRDVDLTILSDFGSEERWIEPLVEHFEARRSDALDFALRTRVVLLQASNGVPLDVSLGALPVEERIVARSSRHEFLHDVALRTCSAEDLVVLKSFANRTKDWLDIEGVIVRQAGHLDAELIWRELRPLIALKEEREIQPHLEKLLASD